MAEKVAAESGTSAAYLCNGEYDGHCCGPRTNPCGPLRQRPEPVSKELRDALPSKGRRRRALLRADAVGSFKELVGSDAHDGAKWNTDQLRLELLPRRGFEQVPSLEVC